MVNRSMRLRAAFKIGDIVEQKTKGDLLFFVRAIDKSNGVFARYILEGIDGSRHEGIPDYLVVRARPPAESKWGRHG